MGQGAISEELEHYETLRDGTEIFFRPVQAHRRFGPVGDAVLAVGQSVRKRYFTHTRTFPHKDVQKLTNIDYEQNLAIVGVVPGPGGRRGNRRHRPVLPRPQNHGCRGGLHRPGRMAGQGHGQLLLLDYITKIAKERSVKSFYATVLPSNKAMLSIFYNSGYKVNTEFDGDCYTITYEIQKKK
jgi:acetyltransferase